MAKTTTIFVPANHELTITADEFSTGYYVRLTDSGSEDYTALTASSSSTVVSQVDGRNYRIVSDTGELTYVYALVSAGGIKSLVEDTTPQLGGNLDINSKELDFTTTDIDDAIDDDTMASASDSTVATSESIKAYVDATVSGATDPVTLNADDATQETLNLSTQELQVNLATTTTDGAMAATDKDKLDNIEANATIDQTGAEIKSLYEAESDTNAFTDAEQSKLSGIEANATIDQTGAEIKSLYEAESDTNAFTDAEQSKLSGIEASADVTDETNVVSSLGGATLTGVTVAVDDKVMLQDTSDSDNVKTVTTQAIADLKVTELSEDTSPVLAANLDTSTFTVDGRDVSTDGSKLDNIEANADVTDETNVLSSLDGATISAVTVAVDDRVIIQDTSDSCNVKTVTTQAIADLASSGLTNPMTTAEDIIVGGSSGTPARLAVGNESDVLTVSGGDVAWVAPSGGSLDYELLVASTPNSATSIEYTNLSDDYNTFVLIGEITTADTAANVSIQFGQTNTATPSTAAYQTMATAYQFINHKCDNIGSAAVVEDTDPSLQFATMSASTGCTFAIEAHHLHHTYGSKNGDQSNTIGRANWNDVSTNYTIVAYHGGFCKTGPNAGAGYSTTYDAIKILASAAISGTIKLYGIRSA